MRSFQNIFIWYQAKPIFAISLTACFFSSALSAQMLSRSQIAPGTFVSCRLFATENNNGARKSVMVINKGDADEQNSFNQVVESRLVLQDGGSLQIRSDVRFQFTDEFHPVSNQTLWNLHHRIQIGVENQEAIEVPTTAFEKGALYAKEAFAYDENFELLQQTIGDQFFTISPDRVRYYISYFCAPLASEF